MHEAASERADILTRFMRGEIDAPTAVHQIKLLPPREGDEYVAWPEDEFSPEHLKAKLAELRSAWGPELFGPAA